MWLGPGSGKLFFSLCLSVEEGLFRLEQREAQIARRAFGLEVWWVCHIVSSLSSVLKRTGCGHLEIMLLTEQAEEINVGLVCSSTLHPSWNLLLPCH